MKKLLFIVALGISLFSWSQNAGDAYRYSSYTNAGTSRFMGLSGAMGSVGGDLSTLNYNPAGMGIYKTSEYVFAPRYLYNSTQADYSGQTRSNHRDNFNYGLFGVVSSIPLFNAGNPNAAGWKFVQFGFSYSRVDNYRSDIFIEGKSYGGSKVFEWQDDAQGNYPDNLNAFGSGLAWETYLLDTINGYPDRYITAVPKDGVSHSYSSFSEGYKNEMTFALSGNYNNKLFVGTSMVFSFLRYNNTTILTETALKNPANYEFDYFKYREELSTIGNGFNAKFGLIYIINSSIRLNAAFHTPTWFYNMNDYYFTRVDSKMGDGQSYYQSSPNGSFDYKLTTPLRAMGGVSVFIQNMGFISVDYEYMDFGSAYFKDNYNSLSDVNQEIKEVYSATHSVRIGGELRLNPFFIRGGYGLSTSGIDTDINELFDSQYSLGFGYRAGAFAFDFSFMRKRHSQNYYMYDSNFVNPAFLQSNTNFFSATLGFKF
ncbi:MAG: hypothetical protein KAH25_00185 [Bacteroidales bacterium]|nr:hypothetical protein [Bacteroidales bacterium]